MTAEIAAYLVAALVALALVRPPRRLAALHCRLVGHEWRRDAWWDAADGHWWASAWACRWCGR